MRNPELLPGTLMTNTATFLRGATSEPEFRSVPSKETATSQSWSPWSVLDKLTGVPPARVESAVRLADTITNGLVSFLRLGSDTATCAAYGLPLITGQALDRVGVVGNVPTDADAFSVPESDGYTITGRLIGQLEVSAGSVTALSVVMDSNLPAQNVVFYAVPDPSGPLVYPLVARAQRYEFAFILSGRFSRAEGYPHPLFAIRLVATITGASLVRVYKHPGSSVLYEWLTIAATSDGS